MVDRESGLGLRPEWARLTAALWTQSWFLVTENLHTGTCSLSIYALPLRS